MCSPLFGASALFALDPASSSLWLRVLEPLLCPEALGLACNFSVSLGGVGGRCRQPPGRLRNDSARKKKNASHSSLGKDGSVFPVLGSSTPGRSSKERVRDIQVEERPTQKQREMLREELLWDHIEM